MKNRGGSSQAIPRARRNGSREAIVEAAQRLFLERGFGAVSMDELAEAAGVARRTLYNQFASKEEIFREMLLKVSGQLEDAFPPGIETQGDVEDVLRLIARMILELHKRPEYLGFLRMVVADSRQFRGSPRNWPPSWSR
jgi:TetR/AcrR family transcriptional regulator of autoinduction and epiphytic fitness